MNTNTTTRRRIAAFTIAAIGFPAFAACGSEIAPPAQNIGRDRVQQEKVVPAPQRTTGNRWDFDDEYGKAKVPARTSQPAGSGTRNRMDFGDEWR